MPRLTSRFRGYSTIGTNFLNPRLADLALAKQDLLNHFNTRKGERLMMPTFGSIVWDMLFEPLDEETMAIIEEDVRVIIKNDPRWQLNAVEVIDGPNSIQVDINLTYLPEHRTIDLPLTYNKGTNTI